MKKPASPHAQDSSFLRMLFSLLALLGLFFGFLTILKNPESSLPDKVLVQNPKPTREQVKTEEIAASTSQESVRSSAARNEATPLHDEVDDLYQQAMIAAREKSDNEAARVMLEEVLKRDPNHIAAADELFAIYERHEDFEGALAVFQKLATENPDADHAALDYGEGRLYLEFGHPDEARIRLERALESGKNHPVIHEQLASAYMSLGEKELARREWQMLAQDESAGRASLNAKARLAEVLFAEGQQAEAESYIKEVLKQDPQHRLGMLLSGR